MDTHEYYQNRTVLLKMLPFMQNREVAFIQKIGEGYSFRNIKIVTLGNLVSNLQRFEMYKYPYRIYNSTAVLNDMPMFSFKMVERKTQSKVFHETFMNYVNSYDFVLDIDNKGDFKECYEQTKRIMDALDEAQICYYIKFSGSGFNLVVPHQHIGVTKQTDLQERYHKIALEVHEIVDANLLDTNIYLMREITKTLFSLDTKNNTVCMPLSRKEFNAFTHEMVDPQRMFEPEINNKTVVLNNPQSYGCLEKLEGYCEITSEGSEEVQEDLTTI